MRVIYPFSRLYRHKQENRRKDCAAVKYEEQAKEYFNDISWEQDQPS